MVSLMLEGHGKALPQAESWSFSTTREIMARFGNMSSPSVLFTLQEIMENGIRPGDFCLMAAFGAGLSAHALLLQASGDDS